MKVLKWVPVSSSQTSTKMFGKKVMHTSKNRVGRRTHEKDLSQSNGEDSNQGSLYVDENTQQSQDSDSPATNMNLNEDSNFSLGCDMTNDTDSNDVNNSMSAALKLVRNDVNEESNESSEPNGSPEKKRKSEDKSPSS